ncbi:aldo/keto reductase [Streptomyces graminilatus]|uniref:aldo/keto reductase n=1 Tax=Streptomyces graminilatus TaxID=1464070 RepID=UPI0006E1A0F0|nr:aldo/keto reductase [Streptomyces graminilatus]
MSPELALGTYHCRDIPRAVGHATARGVVWIDAAPNYRAGHAHTLLVSALPQPRQVRISTKTGFFVQEEGEAAVEAGILTPEEAAAGHSLTADFLRWQTSRSLDVLGRADCVFVHNPEHATDDRDELHALLRNAFTVLEEFTDADRIGGYGVATWSGLDSGAFTVPEILTLAQEAAGSGDHHLRAVQLPVSLVMVQPISLALDGRGPLVHAHAAGLDTFVSSPLHGGELPGMVTRELAELIGPGLTTAQAALRVVASTPGVTRVLLGTHNPAHWDAAANTLALPPLPLKTLRKVIDVLGP